MTRKIAISGGSGGIGSRICERLVARGFSIENFDLKESSLVGVITHLGDITGPEAFKQETGPVDHVFAVAGGPVPAEVVSAGKIPSLKAFSDSVELNLLSSYALCERFLPELISAAEREANPSITFISSINALGGAGPVAYSSAKGALHSLAATLAPRLGPLGIRVNCVLPGTIDTPLIRQEMKTYNNPERLSKAGEVIPLRRVGLPDDIACVVEHLALDFLHVTGQAIIVDGGQSLRR